MLANYRCPGYFTLRKALVPGLSAGESEASMIAFASDPTSSLLVLAPGDPRPPPVKTLYLIDENGIHAHL